MSLCVSWGASKASAVDLCAAVGERPVARRLLRLEGLAAFVLALLIYQSQGYAWSTLAGWVLLPDVALLAYLSGSARVGMWAYNSTHSSLGPAALGGWGVISGSTWATQAALIWFVHIGFDRMLGYGLKGPVDFKQTHLGWLGRGGSR